MNLPRDFYEFMSIIGEDGGGDEEVVGDSGPGGRVGRVVPLVDGRSPWTEEEMREVQGRIHKVLSSRAAEGGTKKGGTQGNGDGKGDVDGRSAVQETGGTGTGAGGSKPKKKKGKKKGKGKGKA